MVMIAGMEGGAEGWEPSLLLQSSWLMFKNKKKPVNSPNDPNNYLPDWKFYFFLGCFIFSILVLTSNEGNLESLSCFSSLPWQWIKDSGRGLKQWISYIGLLWIIGWFTYSFVRALLFILLSFECILYLKIYLKKALNWVKD